MRTLILSDLHLGDDRYEQFFTYCVLLRERYDRLILNGDFIDFWVADLDEVKKCSIFKLISKIAEKKEVIWILGNHDDAPTLSPSDKIKIVPDFTINENGYKTLIIHGHQAYKKGVKSWGAKLLCKFNYLLTKLFKLDLQILNKTRLYDYLINKKRKKLIEANPDFNMIITGHTHRIGHFISNNQELYDLGCAPLTHSYGILENQQLIILIKNNF